LNTPNNTFGIVTAQNNQPREAQFALRLAGSMIRCSAFAGNFFPSILNLNSSEQDLIGRSVQARQTPRIQSTENK
jgi:hypothetical protein